MPEKDEQHHFECTSRSPVHVVRCAGTRRGFVEQCANTRENINRDEYIQSKTAVGHGQTHIKQVWEEMPSVHGKCVTDRKVHSCILI